MDDKTSLQDRLLYCDKLNWTIDQLKGKTKDGFYLYQIDQVEASHDGHVSLSHFSLIPAYPRDVFFKKKGYQDDYWQIKLPMAEAKGVDLKAFFERGAIQAGQVELKFDDTEVFRDKRLIIDPQKHTELPQQQLRNIKREVKIDSLRVFCPKLVYTEREATALNESRIYFTNIDGRISNITNMSDQIKRNHLMGLNINGLLAGEGPLSVDARFDLRSAQNKFQVQANCGSIGLDRLNPILEPGMKVSIREGICQNLDLQFEANEDSSLGSMEFAYSDLKVALFSAKEGVMKEEKLISFFVNNLALKDQNPKDGKEIEPVPFKNHRDKQRSVVNYIWKSVLAGLKGTFGIKEKGSDAEKRKQ